METKKKKSRKTQDHYSLSQEDREFFARISEATFLNPFSDEQAAILKLIPGYTPEKHPGENFLWTLGPVLKERIARLEQKGLNRIQQFDGADRRLMEDAFLLEGYFRFVPEINELVQKQVNLGGTSIEVSCGKAALAQAPPRH